MLLKLDKLCCGYNKKSIVEDVSVTMAEGELWCILGANGIGKSTLFKTILGLLNPVSGEVFYRDKLLKNWKQKDLAKIVSYVPQSHTPPFPFRVFEVVLMGRYPYQNILGKTTVSDARKVNEALKLLKIEHLTDRVYTQISGGERQLVLLARAIVQETPILVLDEPVSNLDFGNHAKVIKHICQLVEMGKTVIMTTHYPDHAFLEQSNVLLIQNKNKVVVGRGKDIINEKCIHDVYGVDSKILIDKDNDYKTCIPIY
ncbi:MAG: ABC transporter ATP-binding protein [Lachnospirales bacterium]